MDSNHDTKQILCPLENKCVSFTLEKTMQSSDIFACILDKNIFIEK